MVCYGNKGSEICMYSSISRGVFSEKFFISKHMNLHFWCLVCYLVVFLLLWGRYSSRFPLAVIWMQYGLLFCGLLSMMIFPYVTVLCLGMALILLCDMTKIELVLGLPVLVLPWARSPNSLQKAVSHVAHVSMSLFNHWYCVIVLPVMGCTTVAQKWSMSMCVGIGVCMVLVFATRNVFGFIHSCMCVYLHSV